MSTNLNNELIVVSAFGRGNWMAAELAKRGVKSLLLDLTSVFGHWGPEDWEGPFGVFQSEKLTDSQITRLGEEDFTDVVSDGFVLWLKDGVLDSGGPISPYLFEKRRISEEQKDYVAKFDSLDPSKRLALFKKFAHLPFKETWFTHLAHSLAANSFVDNAQSHFQGRPLPLFSQHGLRRNSRRGFEQNLEWVESWGAKVLKVSALKDLSFNSGFVQSIELESDYTGVLSADQYVWCLTGLETRHVSTDIAANLFPNILQPSWQWQRYRFQFSGEGLWSNLPSHVTLVEDLGVPWTHENLIVLQKSVEADCFDAWLRLPQPQRFHRAYLENMARSVAKVLESRMTGVRAECVNFPPEHSYDERDLGPARFPLYDSQALAKYQSRSWINLNYDSPEQWDLLDWTQQMAHQGKIVEDITNWKKERDERVAKANRNSSSDQPEAPA